MIQYRNNITILSTPLPVDTRNYFGLTTTLNVVNLFTFGGFDCLCPYNFTSRLFPHCNINLSPPLSHPVFSSEEETYSCIFVFHRLGRISGGQLVQISAQSQTSFDVISHYSGSCAVEFWECPKMEVLQLHLTVCTFPQFLLFFSYKIGFLVFQLVWWLLSFHFVPLKSKTSF